MPGVGSPSFKTKAAGHVRGLGPWLLAVPSWGVGCLGGWLGVPGLGPGLAPYH